MWFPWKRRRRKEAFHSELLTAFTSAIVVEDENRLLLHANEKFASMFGVPVPVENMIGEDCGLMAEQAKPAFLHPEYFINRIKRLLRERVKVTNDLLYMADRRCLERDYIPVFSGGEYVGHLWVYRDVTELHKQSITDKMTGLYNRRGLELFAEQYLRIAQRTPDQSVYLVFADIDGLKKVNDTYGHDPGDELIRDAARVLKSSFRDSDLCCRLGGDEFVALTIGEGLCPEVISERLSRFIEVRNRMSGTPYQLSISFGIHRWSGEDLGRMIRDADTKMYKSKKAPM